MKKLLLLIPLIFLAGCGGVGKGQINKPIEPPTFKPEPVIVEDCKIEQQLTFSELQVLIKEIQKIDNKVYYNAEFKDAFCRQAKRVRGDISTGKRKLNMQKETDRILSSALLKLN